MSTGMLQEVSAYPHVLIVEDDDDTREMLELLLRTNHYEPILASSGEQALEMVVHEPVDLVVLDLGLPGMSGYDVCERIRMSEVADVPIIMLTASHERQGPARGLRLGADDYLRKPFMTEELLGRIEAIRRRDQRSRSLINENEALREAIEHVQTDLQATQTRSETETVLRREFLHNVSTHLQALYRVIEAEYRRQTNPAVRETVQRILGRVRGAVLVYETSEILQDDPADVDELIRSIAAALKSIYSPRRRLPVEFKGGQVQLPLTLAAPVAMIANELVSNCFRHAFPDQRFGTITLTYYIEDGDFVLLVNDDGVGMPQHNPLQGRGLNTVQLLMQQLGGTVEWRSTSMDGTTVHLRLPLATPGLHN
jgi:DNA-binding response OmpR family regulator/anti-sigma regulatory factor (Ser/Thr protein kinase)